MENMINKQKSERIIFLSTISDVDEYIKYNKSSIGSKNLIIAMNPHARAYLKRKGIAAQDTLNFFTNDSHKKVLEKSEELINWLRNNSCFVNFLDIEAAFRDSFVYWMRLVIHYLLWTIEIVSNCVETHRPQVISGSKSSKKSLTKLHVDLEEKYLGYIVKEVAERNNLKYEDISSSETTKGAFFSRTADHVYLVMKFIAENVRCQFWKNKILLEKRNIKKDKFILFTTRSYRLDELAQKIQKEFPEKMVHFLIDPIDSFFNIPNVFIKLFAREYAGAIIDQKKMFRDLICRIENKTELFSYKDLPFSNIFLKKIKSNICNYITGFMLWALMLDKFINEAKPSAVLSGGNRDDDPVTVELCKRNNIPSVLISHGSHVRPKNKYEDIEWGEHGRKLLRTPFTFLALQSPLSEGYLKAFPSKSESIKTGPLIWGKEVDFEKSKLLFKKMFGKKYKFGDIKIILHAGTPKSSNGLRLYVYETPDEYIRALCDLADVVERIEGATLIIKFRPSAEIGVDDLKVLVPFSEKVILSTEESFSDVLGMADLLVSFASTTIEEAFQNHVPVLLYGGGGRYQHILAATIGKETSIRPSAVYHVQDKKNLGRAIREILDLNIEWKGKDRDLFDQYIYSEDVRTSLVDTITKEG